MVTGAIYKSTKSKGIDVFGGLLRALPNREFKVNFVSLNA
jgi:hypothetical protein